MASSSMCKAVTPVTASRAIQTKAAAVHSCAKRQKLAENEIQKIRELDQGQLQRWTEHSTLIFENLKQ